MKYQYGIRTGGFTQSDFLLVCLNEKLQCLFEWEVTKSRDKFSFDLIKNTATLEASPKKSNLDVLIFVVFFCTETSPILQHFKEFKWDFDLVDTTVYPLLGKT